MELIRQPNAWSCNACAWAMVLGLSLAQVIHALGHDGSAVWHPALPEPKNRRGFVDEELVWLAVQRGYACTDVMLDTYAAARYGPLGEGRRLCTARDLAFFLPHRRGVLTVQSPAPTSGAGLHAVAWDGEWVYDPLFGVRLLSDYEIKSFLWIERVTA